MKLKKIFNIVTIIFVIIFIASIFAIELNYYGDDVNRLSSKDYTPEVKTKIKRYSAIYQFYIVFMLYIIVYSFISIFTFLTSPLIGGKVYKIALVVLLYITSIIISIRGYSAIFDADWKVNLTGVITYHFYETAWTHMVGLVIMNLAELIKKWIAKDLVTENEQFHKNSKNNKFETLKEIINEKSGEKK